LAYCVPTGIPHSVLKGRIVRPGESAWLQADVDKALLWRAYESRRCRQCGSHPDEWPPDTSDDVPPYFAEANRCFGCQDIAAIRRGIPQGEGGDGIQVTLKPFVGTWDDVDEIEQQREANRRQLRTLEEAAQNPDAEKGLLT
jgi:hypothetical protein